MKKLNILGVTVLGISAMIFGGFLIYQKKNEDPVAPRIQCSAEEIFVSVQDSKEEILTYVTASDDQDGNLTDQVMIEKMSDFIMDHTRNITFAVADSRGNVTRTQTKLTYTDYTEPRFSLNAPLRISAGYSANPLKGLSAQSCIDGDLTHKIKYSMPSSVDYSTPGTYPIEFSVLDSTGTQVYLETEIQVYSDLYEQLQIELSDYLVYIEAGSAFDPMEYVQKVTKTTSAKEVSYDRSEFYMESSVDTRVPGTYLVKYHLQQENSSGNTQLVVVVE